MGFLKKVMGLLGGGSRPTGGDSNSHWVYVRCQRCNEALATRINLANDLSVEYDENDRPNGYHVRKLLMGTGAHRCYQQVEVEVEFDAQKRPTSHTVRGGAMITSEEYEKERET
jgi:hypothetical protein